MGPTKSSFRGPIIARYAVFFIVTGNPDSLSPVTFSTAAWNAKIKSDFAEVWNGGVTSVHKSAVSTSVQVHNAMPFHLKDVTTAMDDKMRKLGSLADENVTSVQDSVNKALGRK